MKYKVGDIVKLRDDLEVNKFYGNTKLNEAMVNVIGKKAEIKEIVKNKNKDEYYAKFASRYGGNWFISDEMIEGLWEECKSSEQVSKLESKLESKYKLIDILNKIANGELKEGTKVIWDFETYRYDGHNRLWRFVCDYTRELWDDISLCNLNDECELIEVEQIDGEKVMDEFAKGKTICEHEWEEYVNYNGNTKTYTRKCNKCDLEEEIEPTDNTKIEELVRGNIYSDITTRIIDKLNEVIRYINK